MLSQVYTCSADEFNNQHCAVLSTDKDFPLTWILLGILEVPILTLAFNHFVDKAVRYWQERRAMPVESDASELAMTTDAQLRPRWAFGSRILLTMLLVALSNVTPVFNSVTGRHFRTRN